MKRILSHATLGAIQAASLSIAAIGKAMAWARGEDVTSKHGVDTYGRRFTTEETFRDVMDLKFVVVVLRVFSPAFDVKAFLGRFPDLEVDAVWMVGEKKLLRETHANSGFNLTLAEADTSAQALAEVRQRLSSLSPVLAEVRRQSASCLVDFGMFIGGERQFSGTAEFAPEDLRWFAEQGLGIAVSAYPTSDEEEIH